MESDNWLCSDGPKRVFGGCGTRAAAAVPVNDFVFLLTSWTDEQ